MSAAQVKQRLSTTLEFLQPYWDFVNCHMVNFLVDNHWDNFVPTILKLETTTPDQVSQCIKEILDSADSTSNNNGNFQETFKFIKSCEQHSLKNYSEIVLNSEVENLLRGNPTQNQPFIKGFMSLKKKHEVQIIADLVHNLIESKSEAEKYVIDAGDGKGYLSSILSIQYGYHVLGIDSSEVNTKSAQDRMKKLQRNWPGVSESTKLGEISQHKEREPSMIPSPNGNLNKNGSYKPICLWLAPELDLQKVLIENFPQAKDVNTKVCLTGLHTCGNLAPSCLQLFHKNSNIKTLCNIGCCYHLLKENFETKAVGGPYNNQIVDAQTIAGFPMSEFLKEKKVMLGRNARMLASQSIERTLHSKNLPNVSLFYRALLEVLIEENCPHLKGVIQVGKIRNFHEFGQYVELCEKKCNLNFDNLNNADFYHLEQKFGQKKNFLNLFYLLRMFFAPVLETVILLDRLLYLKELNYHQSYLFSAFDAVISPRNFSIIAIKNN